MSAEGSDEGLEVLNLGLKNNFQGKIPNEQLFRMIDLDAKMLIFRPKLGFWTISTRVIHLGMSDFFLEPVVRYRIENGRILLVEWTGGKMNGAEGDFVESEFWSKVELEFVLHEGCNISAEKFSPVNYRNGETLPYFQM